MWIHHKNAVNYFANQHVACSLDYAVHDGLSNYGTRLSLICSRMFRLITRTVRRAASVSHSSDQVTRQRHGSPHKVAGHDAPQPPLPLDCTLSWCPQLLNDNIVHNENPPPPSELFTASCLTLLLLLSPFLFPPVCVLVTISSPVRLHDSISEEGFHYLVFDLWVTASLSPRAVVNFGSGALPCSVLSWNLCICISSAVASKHPAGRAWQENRHHFMTN